MIHSKRDNVYAMMCMRVKASAIMYACIIVREVMCLCRIAREIDMIARKIDMIAREIDMIALYDRCDTCNVT